MYNFIKLIYYIYMAEGQEEKVIVTQEILDKNPQLVEQGIEIGAEVDASQLVSEEGSGEGEGNGEGGADDGAAE